MAVDIESGDVTATAFGSPSDPLGITYPAYVSGDLLIFHIGLDSNPTITTPSAGPDSETITAIVENETSAGSGGPVGTVFWFIGGSTQSTANLNVSVSSGSRGRAYVVKVPAGEFDATTPIQSGIGQTGSSTGSDSTIDTDPFTADATDNGRLVHFLSADAGGVTTTISVASGFSAAVNESGSITCAGIFTRDTITSASESIGSTAFSIDDPDTNMAISYIVNASAIDTVDTAFRGMGRGIGRGLR